MIINNINRLNGSSSSVLTTTRLCYWSLCDFLYFSPTDPHLEVTPIDRFWRKMAQTTWVHAKTCIFGVKIATFCNHWPPGLQNRQNWLNFGRTRCQIFVKLLAFKILRGGVGKIWSKTTATSDHDAKFRSNRPTVSSFLVLSLMMLLNRVGEILYPCMIPLFFVFPISLDSIAELDIASVLSPPCKCLLWR